VVPARLGYLMHETVTVFNVTSDTGIGEEFQRVTDHHGARLCFDAFQRGPNGHRKKSFKALPVLDFERYSAAPRAAVDGRVMITFLPSRRTVSRSLSVPFDGHDSRDVRDRTPCGHATCPLGAEFGDMPWRQAIGGKKLVALRVGSALAGFEESMPPEPG